LISWINDNLGVRRSLIIGFSISALSSTIVALTASKTLLYVILFALYPFGTSMGIPMLTVAIKRYTTSRRRGFAFGLYYSVMNVAALVSGPVVDLMNIGIQDGLMIGSLHLSGNRLVILTCTLSNLLSLLIALRYIREVKVAEELTEEEEGVGENDLEASQSRQQPQGHSDGMKFSIEDPDSGDGSEEEENSGDRSHRAGIELRRLNFAPPSEGVDHTTAEVAKARVGTGAEAGAGIEEYRPPQHHPCETVKELLTSPTFWRFAILTLLLVNLHAIFRHLDATEPTYLLRCFGSSVPKGSLYSINPLMIIFLTPLVAMLTSGANHFDMIKWGGYLTAASPFFPAIATALWAVVAMNVLLSLGEAIWSPRLYDYVMTIAPEVFPPSSLPCLRPSFALCPLLPFPLREERRPSQP
jgi:proton-dependent oligopeptide transporter, POT family